MIKNIKKAALPAALCAVMSAPAMAGEGIFEGAHLGDVSAAFGLTEWDNTVVVGKADYDLPNARKQLNVPIDFALQGRFGLGLGEADNGVSVNYLMGGYVIGRYGINDRLNVYALAGLTYYKLTAKVTNAFGTISADGTDTDFSFGIGTEYKINDTLKASVEYADVSGLAFGVSTRF